MTWWMRLIADEMKCNIDATIFMEQGWHDIRMCLKINMKNLWLQISLVQRINNFVGVTKEFFLNNPLKISTHKLCIKRPHFLGGGKSTSL
jgi:hypothetical protein